MESKSLSIVLLAHNEIGSIKKDIDNLIDNIGKYFVESEIIIVEDGSTDGTTYLLNELHKKKIIKHIHSKTKLGYTNAFIKGVKQASYEKIFFSDTGGKFDFYEFWKLNETFEKSNSDLTIGYRKLRHDSYLRRILTQFFNIFLRLLFKIKIKDSDSGFRIYRKSVLLDILENIKVVSKHLIAAEITIKFLFFGKKVNEVEVSYFQREGESRGIPPNKLIHIVKTTIFEKYLLKKELNKLKF